MFAGKVFIARYSHFDYKCNNTRFLFRREAIQTLLKTYNKPFNFVMMAAFDIQFIYSVELIKFYRFQLKLDGLWRVIIDIDHVLSIRK